jgi:hypothetical protein
MDFRDLGASQVAENPGEGNIGVFPVLLLNAAS